MNRTSIKTKFELVKLNNESKMTLLDEYKLNGQFPHTRLVAILRSVPVWHNVHIDANYRIIVLFSSRKV